GPAVRAEVRPSRGGPRPEVPPPRGRDRPGGGSDRRVPAGELLDARRAADDEGREDVEVARQRLRALGGARRVRADGGPVLLPQRSLPLSPRFRAGKEPRGGARILSVPRDRVRTAP